MQSRLRVIAIFLTFAVLAGLLRGSAASVAAFNPSQSKSPTGAAPDLMLLDRRYLSEASERVQRGDPALKAAVAELERDAAKALAMTPVSVMDKGVTPPSGDKHDYMSQAPYWWPDPSKPDGRPYIRKDGQRNPEINALTDH